MIKDRPVSYTLAFIFIFISLAPACIAEDLIAVTVTSKWCETCKELKPVLEELEYEYSGKVKFITLDISSKSTIEESKQIAESNGIKKYFDKYKSNIPQVGIICNNSKAEKKRFVGETRKDSYSKAFDKYLLDTSCN